MYIRLVWRSLRPGHWEEFKSYFQDRYVPGTSDTKGLQRRQLLRSTENPDEGISLSFWDTLEDLLSYERSPVRQELAHGLEEFYPALAYPMGDYWVKHFEAISSSAHMEVQEVSGKYIRMVWGKLRPGSWEEYERHYHERVAGSTTAKGLQERQLLRSTEDPDEGISVGIWDTVDDLLNYERSEFRQSLVKEVEHLYRGDHWVKHFEISSTD